MNHDRASRARPVVQGKGLSSRDPDIPAAPSAKHSVPLAEPVVVARFWKNRRGESVQAALLSYEGRECFDIRQFYTSREGKHLPTTKGITILLLRLPELVDAVNKSLARARELGLIDAEKTP